MLAFSLKEHGFDSGGHFLFQYIEASLPTKDAGFAEEPLNLAKIQVLNPSRFCHPSPG